MEHLDHFHLSGDPFCNEPELAFFYESPGHKNARLRMERGIRQAKGMTVLTGPHGSGKSLLARSLFEDLDEETFEVVLMVMLPGATDARAVLARLARELGVTRPGEDRSAILAHIYQELVNIRAAGRKFVLIIDDAQVLGSAAMAEIGGLLSLEAEGGRLLSLLLVGSAALDSCLEGADSLAQRVDVRVRLDAMEFSETRAYIDHRLALVGGEEGLFCAAATDVLMKCSGGRPRLINTLADNALFEAYLRGGAEVGADDVERAAADLGLLAETGPMTMADVETPSDPIGDNAEKAAPDTGHGAPLDVLPSSVPIGKVELVDEPSPLFGDGPADEIPLELADDDLLSLGDDEAGMPSPDAEDAVDRTLDLDVEWIPDSEAEDLGGEPILEMEAEPGENLAPENLRPLSAAVGEGASPPAFNRDPSPRDADEPFLELLDD